MLHMFLHISAFCATTLPCCRGWFLQSAVICSNVERESERIWGWVCTFECVCGGGRAQRIPIPLYSSQQAAGWRIQKEEGSRELGHHGREVCVCACVCARVCESERACALPMPPPPLPPSIPPSCSLCIAWSSQHQSGPPPPISPFTRDAISPPASQASFLSKPLTLHNLSLRPPNRKVASCKENRSFRGRDGVCAVMRW